MTIEKALIAATIFNMIMIPTATLLAPSLAEIVKARVNQQTDTPSTSQPKDKTKRRQRLSEAIILLVCLISTATLFYLLSSDAPVTRLAVLLISVNACAIIVAVFSGVLIVNNDRLRALIESEKQASNAQAHIISDSNARRMPR